MSSRLGGEGKNSPRTYRVRPRVAVVKETLNSDIRPGIEEVYIADPIYMLNVRKEISNATKARFRKDQFLRGVSLDDNLYVFKGIPRIFRVGFALPINEVGIGNSGGIVHLLLRLDVGSKRCYSRLPLYFSVRRRRCILGFITVPAKGRRVRGKFVGSLSLRRRKEVVLGHYVAGSLLGIRQKTTIREVVYNLADGRVAE
jgi:hypothetical protein